MKDRTERRPPALLLCTAITVSLTFQIVIVPGPWTVEIVPSAHILLFLLQSTLTTASIGSFIKGSKVDAVSCRQAAAGST